MASQDKKHNVRIEKWRAMMDSGLFKDKELLKSRIRKGIPMGIRMLAWPQIVDLNSFIKKKSQKYTYDTLIKSFSNNIYEITLDIPRTFPEQQDSKLLRKSLNNVLKALSIVYPKVGYCQGMNFSALRLLQILQDQQAFWILHYVFQNDDTIIKNYMDPKSIQREMWIFERLLKQNLPTIYETLERKKVAYQAYSMKWFMTIYSSGVSQQLFYRIFQVFLNEGWTIIYAVGLALLKNKQNQISINNSDNIFFLLSSQIYQIKNIDNFMNLAYEFEISPIKIKQLKGQYEQGLTLSMKQSSRIRHQKQIQTREKTNQKHKQLMPSNQNIGILTFQSKAQQVNFDVLKYLISQKQKQKSQRQEK